MWVLDSTLPELTGTQASVGNKSQAFIVELKKLSEGKYFIRTGVWNSNNGTINNGLEVLSGGTVYTDQSRGKQTAWNFVAVTDNIYNIISAENHGGGEGAYLTAEGGESTIVGIGSDGTAANAQWKLINVYEGAWRAEVLTALADATEESPVDATDLILDNNFGAGDGVAYTLWSMEASNRNLNGGIDANQTTNNPCGESWQSGGFSMKQEIAVPNGKYVLKAQAMVDPYSDNGALPYVFANENHSEFKTIQNGENSMSGVAGSFTAGMYEVDPIEVIVFDGKLTVGAKCTASSMWNVFDNFRLTYYGPVADLVTPARQAYEAALTAAQNVERDPNMVGSNEESDLDDALSTYGTVTETGDADTDVAAYEEAKGQLETAVTQYNDAKPAYDGYAEEVTRLTELGIMPEGTEAPVTKGQAIQKRGEIVELALAQYPENVALDTDLAGWNAVCISNETGDDVQINSSEHWSGEQRTYYEQGVNGWGANSWSATYSQTFTLPAGQYLFKLASRASRDVRLSMRAGQTSVALVSKGAEGLGINKDGVTSFDPEDEAGFAKNGIGYGWEWGFLPINLDEDGDVEIVIEGVCNVAHNWMSICDAQILAKAPEVVDLELDETSTDEFEGVERANVTVHRALHADRWNTLVLPFDFELPEGWEAWRLDDAAQSEKYTNTIELQLSKVEEQPSDGQGMIPATLSAGLPYFVKPAEDVETITAEDVNVSPELISVSVFEDKVTFVPFFAAQTLEPGSFYLANNKFYFVDEESDPNGIWSNGFRAFFEVVPDWAGAKFMFTVDGAEVTGITTIENGQLTINNGTVYNLNGQRVSHAQRGVYIVNGKKVVIK